MRRLAPRRLAPVLAAAAACLLILSCTPEERHRTLTFFFDGVPPLHPPEEPQKVAARPGTATPGAPQPKAVVWFEHKPSEDEKACGKCHDRDASFALARPVGELCAPCHEKQTREFPRMHGPVAVGDCAACHEAHRSPYEHLVRAPGATLCLRCHEPAPVGGKTLGCPRPSDATACTTCHHPHGGTQPYFLVEATSGAAAEDTSPPPPPDEERKP